MMSNFFHSWLHSHNSQAESSEAEAEAEPGTKREDLEDWKNDLRRRFEAWLETLSEIPGTDAGSSKEDETPDLYSFYEQLTLLASESRRSNRRMAETLSQWGEILERFEKGFQRTLETSAERDAEKAPAGHWLALVDVFDRMGRIQSAFQNPPKTGLFSRNARWSESWDNQRRGFGILVDHMAKLLKEAGIEKIDAEGRPFDAKSMTAVESVTRDDLPDLTVAEELLAGYRRNDQILRLAQVKVSKRPSNEPR